MSSPTNKTKRARLLRKKRTKSESLLWGQLRGKQLCNLKFRREHPIGPYFADFACPFRKLVIEIDGDYHDHFAEQDLRRESYLRADGWNVIRFSDKEVEEDVEAIGIVISRALSMEYHYKKRARTPSGIKMGNTAKLRDCELGN